MPAGRHNSLAVEDIRKIPDYVRKGYTQDEIGQIFGVSSRTILNYMMKDPGLFQAIQEARIEADRRVEKALYQRACGYSHIEEKIFCSKDGVITRVETTKHYPPDTGAAKMWLTNRRPESWRERIEVDHSGQVEQVQVVLSLPEENKTVGPTTVDTANTLMLESNDTSSDLSLTDRSTDE